MRGKAFSDAWHIRRKPGTYKIFEVVAFDCAGNIIEVAETFETFDQAQAFCSAANEMLTGGDTC